MTVRCSILLLCWLPALLMAEPAACQQYSKADSIAGLYAGHSLDHPAMLAYQLTKDLPTEKQKFRALYTWVCTNIRNDYRLFHKYRRKALKWKDEPEELERWQRTFSQEVFKKLREDQKTLCTGYAYLLRELAGHAGIEATVINGYAKTAFLKDDEEAYINHAWNSVLLDGKWYLCDPTWSSGHIMNGKFIADYDDVYFLADPALFILNNYPADPQWTLLDTSPTLKEFLKGPLTYKAAYAFGYKPIPGEAMPQTVVKNEKWNLAFQAIPGLEEAVTLKVCKGAGENKVTPEVRKIDGEYVLAHTFRTKGMYDVHVVLQDKIVSTYSVRVGSPERK